MKTLNIFFVAGIGYYAVSSEFEGKAFPIPDELFQTLKRIYEHNEENGGKACVALFVKLRDMESMPLALFEYLDESELAMTLSFEMDEDQDAHITEVLKQASVEVEKEKVIDPSVKTLKVYSLNPYNGEALIVMSDQPSVGMPFSLQVIQMIGVDELETEAGQQAFITTVEAARATLPTVDTADYVLDEDEVVYSITWMEKPAIVH